MSHLEGFLDDTTGHTAYHAHRRLVGQFHRRVTVVLVVDVFAVVIHDTSAVLERMVGQHGFHLMQTHGHRDAELGPCASVVMMLPLLSEQTTPSI